MSTITNKPPSSSSPISSTRPNPGARNSETKDPVRRSFTGNPFSKPSSIVADSRGGFPPNTPVNSPSDFVRTSSIARESASSLRDFTDKENSKDANLNPAKGRSPASKGTKNFMSPTISAASKFTASPKKKILTERNEPVLSSALLSDAKSQVIEDNDPNPEKSSVKKKVVSFSDIKSLIFEDDDFLKPEMGLNQKKIEASYDSTITDLDEEALKSDFVSDSEAISESKKNHLTTLPKNLTKETDCVNLSPTFKISPRTSCSTSTPMLAPLDADPSMPPYDPKINYLSPRPRFLHYRPNPRIEHIRKRDGKRLEESFVSESFSDSEVSGILSDDSQRESEDVSTDETVKEEEETELTLSEPDPFSIYKPEDSVQAKGVSKSKFFTRSKFIAFLLVLLFVGLSISVIKSPATDFSVLNDLDFSNLYVPPEITEFAVVNFERLAQRYQLRAANSFSYICKLTSDFRKVPKLGPLQYSNLTDLFEEYHMEADAEFKQDQAVLTPIWERDVEIKLSEEDDSEIETNEEVLEEYNSPRFEEQVHQENAEVSEDPTDSQNKEACSTLPAEEVEPSKVEHSDDHNDIKPETHQLEVISEATVIQTETEACESQGESKENFHAEFVSMTAENIHQRSELDIAMDHQQISATSNITNLKGSEVKLFTTNVVGISMLVLLSLLATTAFFKHAKKGKSSTPNAITTTPMEQPSKKKLDYSPISVTSEHWQTEEVDLVGESCPSGMSSFKSSSYSKKGAKESLAQSQERKISKNNRRESLASSDFSMGSPSYGSFTTYEKINKKHGLDDEVVTTPVRRSSRLRNQVTSP